MRRSGPLTFIRLAAARIRGLLRRDALIDDIEAELGSHLQLLIDESIARGMSPAEARSAALVRFGNVAHARDNAFDVRGGGWLEAMWQDLRYGARGLLKNPGFAAAAILTLTLGIGANTAIFSVVNGVLLKPLPWPEPDRLARLFTSFRGSGIERYAVSQPEFMDYKGLAHIFGNAAAYMGAGLTLTGDGEPERVRGIAVTRDFFPVLGVALQGRNFEGEDGRQGVEPVVIVSHEFWRDRLGRDPGVLGRSLVLNGVSRRVIGIVPSGAAYDRSEAFIPLFINPAAMTGRANNYLSVIARLQPGATMEQARREMDALTGRLNAQYSNVYPASMGFGAAVIPMHEEIVGEVRPALMILLGSVALVLLIACANVANLLLARGEARQQEIAVRVAVGASTGRILRQLLTESLMLSILGGAGGMALAWWGTRSLLAINPGAIPRLELIGMDGGVWLATFGVSLTTAFLFGLAPAIQMARRDTHAAMKDGTRGGGGGTGQRLGRALVAAEVALAVVVLIGAALLVRSYHTLQNVATGFDPEHVLAVDLSIPGSRYDPGQAADFYRKLVDGAAALPGVRVAAAASELPPVAAGNNWDLYAEGHDLPPGQAAPSPETRAVTRDYFRALGIPIARGRSFEEGDTQTSIPVAVINETAARAIWQGEDPIGRRARFSEKQPWITIVGVARDVRSMGLAEPAPIEIYVLHDQLVTVAGGTQRAMYLLLRTEGDPAALAPAARRLVRDQDPLLAITAIRTMPEVIRLSMARPRFTMLLLALFAAVALALAAIGIYGIIAYGVRRRTREFGIRMALGARPGDVLRLVMAQGMRLSLLGIVLGAAGAFTVTRLMASLLFGVSARDPLVFGAIGALIVAVAMIASWMPARRAVLVNPTIALRGE
jgi:putative ABC transport system permease protein